MEKQAPTLGKLATIAVFTLSCFGLLIFMWLSFGGAVPLKPKRWRFQAAFPQAIQLALQADVRVAGIPVGKVVSKDVDKTTDRTIATIALDPRFAPLRADAHAILRQKTLLGETFIELTPGTRSAPTLHEGARLANSQISDSVTLDQVLQALDPVTRASFQSWQQQLALAARGHGQDLNDAIGNLPRFVASGGDLLNVLNVQSGALRRLVRNTGVTFDAISQNESQLRNLVTGVDRTFSATASQQNSLAEIFRIFPTFLDESKRTFVKLESFSRNARPLIRDLRPAFHDLVPATRNLRRLAPYLRQTFVKLNPLITSSAKGLPALREILKGTTPLLANLDPFLEQLNPTLQWLEFNQANVGDFISNGETTFANYGGLGSSVVGRYLRNVGPQGAETLAIWPNRLPTNRGNAYLGGNDLKITPTSAAHLTAPNFDCRPSGGPVLPHEGNGTPLDSDMPGCFVQKPHDFQGNTGQFAVPAAANYRP